MDERQLPFSGFDLWTAFELSWLNAKGKPVVGIGEFTFPHSSSNLIESKSFKLYLNSFNQTRFDSVEQVSAAMQKDLSQAANGQVTVKLYPGLEGYPAQIERLPGINIDDLDIAVDDFTFKPEYLSGAAERGEPVSETLSSNLLKSNCLVTNQPDWGSVVIRYEGRKIDRESLLRYLISFRQHNEFHEQCVERIFNDIKQSCRPEKLSVRALHPPRRPGHQPLPQRFRNGTGAWSPDQTVSVIPQCSRRSIVSLSSPCYFSPLSSSAAIFKAH